MTNLLQNQDSGKPQTFKVITHYGYIPLLVDVDGSRWLHLPPFAEWLGLSLVRDIMPRIDTRPRYWGVKLIGGKQCLPADKANSFMGILRVEHAKGPMVAWLGNHCTQTLRNFTIPEVQTPMLVAEPEPVPVSFARPAPQFYAPVTPRGLITITASRIAGESVNSVNARDLHSFLEVGKDFSNWIKDRIEAYDFLEHRDFEVFANSGEKSMGRPAKEYALTLEMAKELAMVERNEKGKQARAYFIECERKSMNPVIQFKVPQTLTEALRMALDLEEKRATLECKVLEQVTTIEVQQASISVMEPKADALDRMAGGNGTTCITGAAKALKVKPGVLTDYMEAHHWIYRRIGPNGPGEAMAFQAKIDAGVLSHRIVPITHRDGSLTSKNQILVTAKGLTKLAQGLGIAS